MFQLHDYQATLVKDTREAISKGAKGVLIQSPAGSGKSVVIAEIARLTTIKQNNVLFIVHRKELAEQIEQTFKTNKVDMAYVTIMTIGKAVNRLEQLPTPSIIITDETHHSRAKSYRKIYDYFFEDAVRLGFTATPWRLNGKGFKDIYDVLIEGQSVEWLIDNNFLAPYKYYAPTLGDLEKLKKSSTGDYSKKSMDKAINKTIFGDVVSHYKNIAMGKQAILYAHSIEASQQMAATFRANGINAVHADSKTPQRERESIMRNFKGGLTKILCNVDLISEGFNVPDCSCVILLRPTESLVLHIQQSMRGMRYKPNKQAIIIDHVGNYERHGLPDTPHDWTLEDREKNKINNKQTDAPSLTACPHCFAMIKSGSNKCGVCGHEIEVESKPLEQVDAELTEVNKDDFKKQFEKSKLIFKYKKKKKKDLETLEDYYLFAKAKDYKEGWIKYQSPEVKNLNWPQFHMKLKPIKEKYKNIM